MNEALTVHVASESDPKLTYTLHALGDVITCSCRGYQTYKKCKHQTALDAVLKEDQVTENGTAIVKADAPPQSLTVGPPPTALLATNPELQAMWAIAKTVIQAEGMVPAAIKTAPQAMAVMLAGWELGLRPMTALRHVYIVNGKTDIETRAMVGIIRQRDPRIQFEWPQYTREAVTCILRRPGQPETMVTYTVADAKASGQYEGKMGIWKAYTRDMLYAAATKRACRLGAPDLINAIEGSMTTVSDAEMAVAPVQARVLDAPPAENIAPEMYDEGDDPAAPLGVEVEAPDPKVLQAQILADITRARAEWNDVDFKAWRDKIVAAFPAAFDENGKPQFTELDAEALGALAARVRADVGEPVGQGALV